MNVLKSLVIIGALLSASTLYGKDYITCEDAVKRYVPKADVREVVITEDFTQFGLMKTTYHTEGRVGYVFMGRRENYKLTDEFKNGAVFMNICTTGEIEYDIWISKSLLQEI